MLSKVFILWTFVLIGRPQDFLPFLTQLRPALTLTILTLFISFFNHKISLSPNVLRSKLTKRYFLFYFIMIIGVPFSVHRGISFDFITMQYINKIIYFYLFVLYIDTREKLETIIFVICLSTLFYAVLCLINSENISGRFHYGTMYDPNDLAYFLISLLPFNLYFLIKSNLGLKKLTAIATISLSVILVVITGSRGGAIGLATVFLLIFCTKLGLLKTTHKLILLVLIIAVTISFIEKVDTDRYWSIFNLKDDYNITAEDGRLTIWKRGLELTLMNPITGVGVNCFPVAIGNYRADLGLPPKWQAPHNSYLGVLAELGLFGFIVYILIIVSTIKTFLNCAKRDPITPTHDQIIMISRVALLAFVGLLTCAFFLSMSYNLLFTLFFALSVVLQNLFSDPISHPEKRS